MRHSKVSARIITVVVVLLLSAFAVNSMRAQGGSAPAAEAPTATPTNPPAATATATPTVAPTHTPPPTATPMPTQTQTPLPTATTPPTLTPTPTTIPSQTPRPTFTATNVPMATTIPPTMTPAPVTSSALTVNATGPLQVTQVEPTSVASGQSATLSILGANFTKETTVRLVGYGFLQTTFMNSSALTAALPSGVPAGTYAVEVSDATSGTFTAPGRLNVIAPVVAASTTPVPTETPKPTDIPGQPNLVVRSFSAAPASIYPGGTTQITVEVVNFGSRPAEGIVIALGDSKFTPANGQASVTVAYLAPTVSYSVILSIVAPSDATEGPASIPLLLTSQDFSGQLYKDNATVSVNILAKPSSASQVVLKSFTVLPASALPGQTVTLNAVIGNVGNVMASHVLLQLDATSAVLIAGTKGNSVSIGTLKAGASKTITLPLVVGPDAKAGVQAQSFTINYLEQGTAKQATASISLEVNAKEALAPQVVLKSFTVTPGSALPGQAVSVQAEIANTGNETAAQVLIQLNDANAILIAGTQGNSISVGDLEAGASKSVSLPLVVADGAKSGVQAQSFTISFLQEGTAKQTTASISFDVQTAITESPVLLLKSYTAGQTDPLQPGQQFAFQMTLQNAGKAPASNLMITFGTVKTDSASSTNATSTASSSTSSTSSTTASTTFAPIGSGDTLFVGALPAGQTTTLNQGFIVNSDVTSGVYTLPATLQYQLADGTTAQQSVNASLVVVVPARLRVSLTNTLDDKLTAGQTYSLSLKVANLGTSDLATSKMLVTGDNVSVTKGADTLLDTLSADDNTTQSVSIQPKAAGTYTVNVAVEYLDGLNRTQTYTTSFTGEVAAQAVQQTQRPVQAAQQRPQDQNLLGRLLLGFLGLGG